MLYHYTSIQALEGILRGCPSEKGLCFWASRYDCFGDKEEYKIGIETIKALLPKVENKLQADRRVASSFDWNSIKENIMLPMPYVISLTKRCDNDHMWENYADHGHGVVLALDETKKVSFESMPHMIMLKPCIYKSKVSDEELFKEIETEYFNGAFGMLTGPKKEFALGLLKDYPQVFVKLIAMYLLGYAAPRIELENKNNNQCLENIKSINYLEKSNYRRMLSFIESQPYQICIMGHSCGNSDRTLLNTLFEQKNCISIKPYFYKKEDGTDNYLELIENISRNFTDMKLMRDRVVNKSFCEPLTQ